MVSGRWLDPRLAFKHLHVLQNLGSPDSANSAAQLLRTQGGHGGYWGIPEGQGCPQDGGEAVAGQGYVAKSSGAEDPVLARGTRGQFLEPGILGLGLGRATHPGFLFLGCSSVIRQGLSTSFLGWVPASSVLKTVSHHGPCLMRLPQAVPDTEGW